MRRLFVHIGSPKAGSTSLQRFLYDNRAELDRAGIYYPAVDGGGPHQHAALAKALSTGRMGPRQGGLTLASLHRMIAENSAPTVVLSSEFFIRAHRYPSIRDALGQLAGSLGMELTAVALVRPQHLRINSSYTQVTKNFKNVLPFRRYCERSLAQPRQDMLDVFDIWMGDPGSTFIALPFSAAHLRPSLEHVFLRAIGMDDLLAEKLAAGRRTLANASPGPMTVAACRMAALRLARETEEAELKSRIAWLAIARAAEAHDWDKTPFVGLTDELKMALWEHFAPSNNLFASKVWGRSWDDVFAAERERHLTSNEIDRTTCSAADWQVLCETVEAACPFSEPGG